MSRTTRIRSTNDLGAAIGAALGEGIAEALAQSLDKLRAELEPLGVDLVDVLRRDVKAFAEEQATAAVREAEATGLYGPDGLRTCQEQGCPRRAIARALCRKHYARTVYQERKARQSTGGVYVPRRRPRAVLEGDTLDKKVVAAVAPIVRRKKNEAEVTEAPAPVLSASPKNAPPPAATFDPVAAAASNAGVTPESVARFLGLAK